MGKGEGNLCVGFVLFFTFDNKEEMFISTHNSLLNTQTHPPFISSQISKHPAKVLAIYLKTTHTHRISPI